jgi:hypothetical protein
MITCDAVSVSLYRNTGVSLSRHAVTHDFAGALGVRLTSPPLIGDMI